MSTKQAKEILALYRPDTDDWQDPAFYKARKVAANATDRVSWFYFYRDDMRDWVFYTDKRGFQERLNVVRDRGLEGFCSWVLGAEDPEIWSLLPSHK